MSSELTDEQLRAIYAWIDAIPLSRPKRNISRDFSDGVMLAEVIMAYFPALVEIHNYPPANSLKQKIYNHETLNQRVLKKLGFVIPRSTIEDICSCKPGAVEQVLHQLQYKMAKFRENISDHQSRASSADKSAPNSRLQNPNNVSPIAAENNVVSTNNNQQTPNNNKIIKNDRQLNNHSNQRGKITSVANNQNINNNENKTVDEQLLLEKEKQIRDLHETVEILELKIAKLEQLVRLKDNKIQKLLAKSSS
eukprot:gene6085-8387_t